MSAAAAVSAPAMVRRADAVVIGSGGLGAATAYFLAKEHGLRSTILRYANVYGPRQDPHGEAGVVAIFTERLIAGNAIQVYARREAGDDGCVRDYVYVGDVVRYNVQAVEGAIAEPISNVCSGVPTTTLALARALAAAIGMTPEIKFVGRRPGDVERSVLEPSAEIAEGYATYSVTKRDGSVVTGTLVAEEDGALVLETGGQEQRIPAAEIAERIGPVSAMPPNGLALAPHELRDLVAYLATL